MKNFVRCLILFLVACGPSPEQTPPDAAERVPPDARAVTVDAAPAPPISQGCNMGNLPGSRTKTYVNGDPIDPAILNELQDRDVLANGPNTIIVPFTDFCDMGASSGAGAVTQGSDVWSIAGQRSLIAGLRLPPGQTVTNIVAKMQQSVASTASPILTSEPFSASNATFSVEANGATLATTGSVVLTPSVSVSVFVVPTKVYFLRFNTTASAVSTILYAVQLTVIGP